MRAFIFVTVIFGFLLSVLPAPGGAQSLGSLLTPETSGETDAATGIDDILDRAAEKGVGVVVIDSDGNVISQPATDISETQSNAEPERSALMIMQDRVVRFRAALVERVFLLPGAFTEVIDILRDASPDGTLMAFGWALIYSLLLFAAGAVVEHQFIYKRVMHRTLEERTKPDPQGYIEKLPLLLFRFVMGVVGILVSMAVAYVLGILIFGTLEDSAMRYTVTLINTGYFACRFIAGLWRMILSPFLCQYRIPALSDRDARRLHRWMWSLATLDVCAILIGDWIRELGLNDDAYAFLAAVFSALIVLMNILLIVVNHAAITRALRNGKTMEQSSMMLRILCRVWAPVVIFYVILAWFELTYDLVLGNPSSVPLIAGAYGILITIVMVYGIINYAIERGFARARTMRRLNTPPTEELEEEGQAAARAMADALAPDETDNTVGDVTQDIAAAMRDGVTTADEAPLQGARITAQDQAEALAPRRQMTTFEELARRVAGILAFVAGAYAFFYIWDNDSAQMVESYADRLLDVMVIMFIGYVIYHAFRIWIDNKIVEETGDEVAVEPGDEGGGSSASRLATLLPLFRNFMLIVVVITILLIVLMEIGVNVGPLFAGAGIVGIAIGFGSQALVRDVFAGAFFLFDDAFRKGEYLDVGNVKGTVEKISVRSFQLRHHLGALHTIPFGELQVITNYSRDWVMMKLPLRVTYDTDVELVRRLIKKLGIRLLDDPVIGDHFIQPLKSQGVIEMQDSAMIVRVKFMTKPGDQWMVRKKVYEEIRVLFEQEGIKFAHREVTVRLADGKADELTPEQKREIAAAAHASLEEDMLEDDNGGGDDR